VVGFIVVCAAAMTEDEVAGLLYFIPAAAAIFFISFSSRFFSFAFRAADSPDWRWRAVACCSFIRFRYLGRQWIGL
jgi:hypothetical protein